MVGPLDLLEMICRPVGTMGHLRVPLSDNLCAELFPRPVGGARFQTHRPVLTTPSV